MGLWLSHSHWHGENYSQRSAFYSDCIKNGFVPDVITLS